MCKQTASGALLKKDTVTSCIEVTVHENFKLPKNEEIA
jgi:hypothetical protein